VLQFPELLPHGPFTPPPRLTRVRPPVSPLPESAAPELFENRGQYRLSAEPILDPRLDVRIASTQPSWRFRRHPAPGVMGRRARERRYRDRDASLQSVTRGS
jgi:hypothetical protein